MIPFIVAFILAQPAPQPPPTTPAPQPAPQPAPAASPEEALGGEQAAPVAPAAPTAPIPPAAPALPADAIRVEVLAVDATGRVAPVTAEIRLERLRRPRPGDDSPATLVGAWVTRTNAAGSAYFSGLPPLGMAESDQVVARYAGLESIEPLTPENSGRTTPVRLVVRSANRDLSPISMSMRVALTPMDALMRVEHVLRFQNDSQQTVDTDDADGLAVPLLVPAPFGIPTAGILPGRPDPNELFFQMEPELGRITTERGGLVYRGPIPPDGLAIRVVMALPYAHETSHTVGLTAPVRMDRLSLIFQAPSHLAPTFAASRPSEVFIRPSQDGEERTLTLITAPAAGEVVTFDIDGTPDRHALMRPLTAGLSIFVVAALLLLAIGAGTRKPSRPTP